MKRTPPSRKIYPDADMAFRLCRRLLADPQVVADIKNQKNPDPIDTLCRDIAAEMKSRGFDVNRAQIIGLNDNEAHIDDNEAHIESYLVCSGIVVALGFRLRSNPEEPYALGPMWFQELDDLHALVKPLFPDSFAAIHEVSGHVNHDKRISSLLDTLMAEDAAATLGKKVDPVQAPRAPGRRF